MEILPSVATVEAMASSDFQMPSGHQIAQGFNSVSLLGGKNSLSRAAFPLIFYAVCGSFGKSFEWPPQSRAPAQTPPCPGSFVYGENVVGGKYATFHPNLPSPPIGVGTIQDLNDIPFAEGKVGCASRGEVELSLDESRLLGLCGEKRKD